jgi:putative ABC transport system substrate-binding protein
LLSPQVLNYHQTKSERRTPRKPYHVTALAFSAIDAIIEYVRQEALMNRREFVALLGSTAAAWPVTARAQQPGLPTIGYLSGFGQNERTNLQYAFRRGLGEVGYVEGRNVAIEYRFAENQPDRLPALAANLVARKVAVIVATGATNPILAARASTTTISIVFTYGGDPVQAGFVASLNRPAGNVTGVKFYDSVLMGKILGLLHEIVPSEGGPLHCC